MTGPPILYLAHRFPYPPDKGDRIRTYNTLRALARKAAVHVIAFADEPIVPRYREELGQLCARLAVIPLGGMTRWVSALASLLGGRTISEGAFQSGLFRRTLCAWTRATPFRAVIASASSLVPYLRLPELRAIPALVDLVDVDSQKWLDYAAASRGPAAWLYRTEGRRLRRLETGLPNWARVTLVSEAETDLYRGFAAAGTVATATNGVDLDYFSPVISNAATERKAPICVFVGAMDYRPNVDAVCWFRATVWPALRQRFPSARFQIVGRNPSSAVRALAQYDGVEVIGSVPDVRPYVREATAVVAPLRIARGLQNKVLEALAMGQAVVASPQALGGFSLKSEQHVLKATTPQDWLQALGRLFDDAELRQRLGAEGRKYAEAHHNWDDCLKPLVELLDLDAASPALAVGSAG